MIAISRKSINTVDLVIGNSNNAFEIVDNSNFPLNFLFLSVVFFCNTTKVAVPQRLTPKVSLPKKAVVVLIVCGPPCLQKDQLPCSLLSCIANCIACLTKK